MAEHQLMPKEETVMSTWGITCGLKLTYYDPCIERASYYCGRCLVVLRNEDPALEKHLDSCNYHPVNHIQGNSDPRSPNPIPIIPRRIGENPDLSIDVSPRGAEASVPMEDTGDNTGLYDRMEVLSVNVDKPGAVNQKEQPDIHPKPPELDPDDADEPVQLSYLDGSRFNLNPDDEGVRMMINYWDNSAPRNRRQFFDLCENCKENRAAYRVLPCHHGPFCAECFFNEESDICPMDGCRAKMWAAMLCKDFFEKTVWLLY